MTIRDWPKWKTGTAIALALLLIADVALGIFVWQMARERPEMMRQRLDRLEMQAKLFRADVTRGEKIRASLPQVGKDCDTFYQQSFLDASTGYSQIDSDLGAIATKAGVRTSGFTYAQKPVKDRGVTEVSIATSLDADYPQILQFIEGIERSKNFYLLDDLRLDSAKAGEIRLELKLHTFFRT